MKAVCFHAAKEIRTIDIARPEKPGAGEALVRVHRVGVCGTDLSGYLGKMPLMTYPRIWGHELGVEVIEVAPDVTHVKPGDRCSVEPYINDPDSYASRRGHPNCCERLRVLGVHIDGGMRPYFCLPARKLHVSKNLAFEQLALVETLAIGCHAVARGNPQADETCLVIGAGPIGLAALEFVKLTGCRMIVLDLSEQRLAFVKQHYPVQHLLKPSDKLEQDLRDLTDGHLPDVVIDATGNAGSMSGAFGLIAPGGRLVYVGITAEEVKFRHATFHRPEGTLLCSRNALPADFERIIGLIEGGKINTAPWITHRCPFEQTAGMFPSFVKPETGVLKAIIEIDQA